MSVRPLDNGKYKAVFKKMDSVTLVGWFVQYANRFKVISPESLKGKIIENLEQAYIVSKKSPTYNMWDFFEVRYISVAILRQ